MSPGQQTKDLRQRLVWIWPLAVAVLIYLPVCRYGFINLDDDLNILANPRFYPVTLHSLVEYWRRPYQGLYIPLTYTIWAGQASLSRLISGTGPLGRIDPGLFHGVNLLLHLANGFLLYRIFRELLNKAAPFPGRSGRLSRAAALGMLFFLVHPVQVEAVAWVTGFKDLLSCFFALLALRAYLTCLRNGKYRSLIIVAATTAYLGAVLAKPSAVIVPVIAVILDRGIIKSSWKRGAPVLVCWILVAVPIIIVTKIVQPATLHLKVPSFPARFLVAADTVMFYLAKTLLPFNLALDYGRTPASVLASRWFFLPVLAAVGLGWLLITRRLKGVGVVSLWIFLAGIVPVSGLIPFRFQLISTVKDRYLYLALFGPALAAAWLYYRKSSKVAGVTLVIAVGFFGFLSWRQLGVWRDMESLYQRVIAVNPESALAHNNLGHYLAEQLRFPEAEDHYRAALKIDPDSARGHYNLGNSLFRRDQREEGFRHYRRALEIDPDYLDAHFNLARELAQTGQTAEALNHYQVVLRFQPDSPDAWNNCGTTLVALGRPEEAADCYRESLRLNPGFAPAHFNLGGVLEEIGEREEAVFHYRQALRLDPEYAQAHYNLAVLYHRDGELHQALAHYTAAIRADPGLSPAISNRDILLGISR